MVDIASITDPVPLPGTLPVRLRADGTPISTPTPGDTFTRATDGPPLDPADPANAELIAAQGELGALAGACAAGAGNGNPIFNILKWLGIVTRCANLVSRIQSSITGATAGRMKSIGLDLLSKATGIEGTSKGNVEYWKDEQKSFVSATKLLSELSKGANG